MPSKSEIRKSDPTYGSAWRPSEGQEWLLRACLWNGDDARAAWQEWLARTDLQRLDSGSYRLLPLLYLNLRALKIEHPSLERIQDVYHSYWYRNQLLFRRAAPVLRALHDANISTLLLKASALIPLYYHDPAVRPMDDMDVLVPTQLARPAMEILEHLGWHLLLGTVADHSDQYLSRHHSHAMRHADGFDLDLHHHVMYFDQRQNADDDFWQAAIPCEFESVATHALHPADQLLHICAHGMGWNLVPPIRWAADAFVLLRESQMDWDRFLAQCAKRDLVLGARNAVEYLATALCAPVPNSVLNALRQMPASSFDRLQYHVNISPPTESGAAEKFWYFYEQYLRFGDKHQSENALLRFPDFLRDTWSLHSTRQVPGYMARYVWRRLHRRTRAQPHSHSLFEDKL